MRRAVGRRGDDHPLRPGRAAHGRGRGPGGDRGAHRRRELPPGAQLPSERDLCEQFGVARTSVREAIQGLVTHRGPRAPRQPLLRVRAPAQRAARRRRRPQAAGPGAVRGAPGRRGADRPAGRVPGDSTERARPRSVRAGRRVRARHDRSTSSAASTARSTARWRRRAATRRSPSCTARCMDSLFASPEFDELLVGADEPPGSARGHPQRRARPTSAIAAAIAGGDWSEVEAGRATTSTRSRTR